MNRSFGKVLSDLVLGTNKGLRLRVRLTLLSASVFCTWLASLMIMEHLGLVSPIGVNIVIVYDLLGLPLFYILIRSGFSSRFEDSAMVEQQMMYAAGVTAIGYLFFPTLRAALMQAMCMSQAFGLFTLRPHQTIRTGVAAIGMLVAVFFLTPFLNLPALHTSFDIKVEGLRLFLSGFILLLLASLSRHYALIRQQVRSDKWRLAEAVSRVNALVTHDALTGLINRQKMQELLELEQDRMHRSGEYFCIALIDLDHFKQINDGHGHHVGDAVLVAFADAVRKILRASDIAARWGGEEFLILMPATDPADQGMIGTQRLLDCAVNLVPIPELPQLKISFSAGVAGSSRDESLEHLLERVDRALYAAKASGRNRCVLANPAHITVANPDASTSDKVLLAPLG